MCYETITKQAKTYVTSELTHHDLKQKHVCVHLLSIMHNIFCLLISNPGVSMQLYVGYEISLTNLAKEWRNCENFLTLFGWKGGVGVCFALP